nr:MAG TPA: hypothetical protein [Caudoviricetes sp.]
MLRRRDTVTDTVPELLHCHFDTIAFFSQFLGFLLHYRPTLVLRMELREPLICAFQFLFHKQFYIFTYYVHRFPPSNTNHRRVRNLRIYRSPQVQAVRMVIDILRLRRVELHNALVLTEKHILNRAHLVPCRAALALCRAGRDANVLPAHSIACDHPERLAADIHLENTVSAVAGAAVKLAFSVFQPELVQFMQVNHTGSLPQSPHGFPTYTDSQTCAHAVLLAAR